MRKYYILFLGLAITTGCSQKSVEVVNKGGSVFKPNYSETYVESPDGKIARSLRGKNDGEKAQEISIINKTDDGAVYVVKEGDNLLSIASKTNMTVAEIAELNDLKSPYPIRIGQKLKISNIATSSNRVVDNQNTENQNTENTTSIYVVKEGDNLSSIASKTNMTVVEIAELNNLKSPYPIRIGQKLKVSGMANQIVEEKTTSKDVGVYVVQSGDNLLSISAKTDMTVAEIAELNNLKSPYPIRVGQKLKISRNVVVVKSADNKKVEKPVAKQENINKNSNSFLWPVKGDILSNFGNKSNGLYNDGINIASSNGSEFRATKNGVVAYVGNELRGYGTIILIKHDSNWISAYAHCGSVKVARGDKVERGQVIGTVGQTGNVDKPQLYFSLRNGREAVDPLKYLKNS